MIQGHTLKVTPTRLLQQTQTVGSHLTRRMASTAVEAPAKAASVGGEEQTQKKTSNAFMN